MGGEGGEGGGEKLVILKRGGDVLHGLFSTQQQGGDCPSQPVPTKTNTINAFACDTYAVQDGEKDRLFRLTILERELIFGLPKNRTTEGGQLGTEVKEK